jgi:hypothetical protein
MPRSTNEALLAFLSGVLLGTGALAKTVTSVSCSVGDVQAAIDAAVAGDTVLVQGGSCTWNSVVTISATAQIALDGGGNTTITWGSSGGLSITAGTTASTSVTGFTFNGSFTNGSCPISFATDTSPLTQAFRFHANTLNGGNPSAPGTFICVSGNGPGLLDHNSFSTSHGADEMIHVLGDGPSDDSGWSDSVPPGGPNMIFIEDNTFICTSSVLASALQSYYGARTVIRHNTFTNAQIDQHGTSGMIGARWWEVYNNSIDSNICLRAGSGVVFSNTNGPQVLMVEEDSGYPALYQIGRGQNQTLDPAYVWDDGTPTLNTVGCAPPVAGMVQLNRDLYVANSGTALPSTCTINQPFWKSDEGTLYKCTSANIWTAYYIPYTYPHPLTGTGSSPRPRPNPPSNLKATVR